jgi:hypothetical protein
MHKIAKKVQVKAFFNLAIEVVIGNQIIQGNSRVCFEVLVLPTEHTSPRVIEILHQGATRNRFAQLRKQDQNIA